MRLRGSTGNAGSVLPPLKTIYSLFGSVKRITEYLSPSFCDEHEIALVEGWRTVSDVIKSRAELFRIFYTDNRDLDKLCCSVRVPRKYIIKFQQEEMAKLSDHQVTPRLAALFRRPDYRSMTKRTKSSALLNLSIILDGLEDAYEIGALIRGSALSGCKSIYSISSSVSLWDQKVIRASAGALFYIPVLDQCNYDQVLSNLRSPHTTIYVVNLLQSYTSNNGLIPSIPYDSVDWTTKSRNVLIVGSSGSLPSEWAQNLLSSNAATLIHIPQLGRLNCLSPSVATVIIQFEAQRQKRMSLYQSTSMVSLSP